MDHELGAWRSDPPAEFAQTLLARLRVEDRRGRAAPRRWRARTLIAPVSLVAGLVALVSVPRLRASATALLAHFRVMNVEAIRVDPARFQALGADHLDLGGLLGAHVEVVEDGGPPIVVDSVASAETRAGLDVRVPSWVPDPSALQEISVIGERVTRVTADVVRLQQVLDTLGITDVSIPQGLEGQQVLMRVPPVVVLRFGAATSGTQLVQARAPEVALPSQWDLATLGDIGLRILGSSPGEAWQLAHTIDWTTTLVVPLPPAAREIRHVRIGDSPGLQFSFQGPNSPRTNTVVWSTGDRVFGASSTATMDDVLAMARSIP